MRACRIRRGRTCPNTSVRSWSRSCPEAFDDHPGEILPAQCEMSRRGQMALYTLQRGQVNDGRAGRPSVEMRNMMAVNEGEARRPSVTDVAKVAGVSVGTVSNVLNRPDSVSERTRSKVEAAIGELNFVRNASARQLRSGEISTVGVVVLDIANPFFTEMARGIED